MRGRLINPMLVEVALLDTDATAADPDGPGPLPSGYDPDFHEPVRLPDGSSARKETSVKLPAQVEIDTLERLNETGAGNVPAGSMRCIFHFQDLEDAGLVDATTGEAKIRIDSRLVAIYHLTDGTLIQKIRTPPGLYCIEAAPQSFGLSGGERNLLVCTFSPRDQGLAAGAGG